MNEYIIVGPNRRRYASSDTWLGAVEKMAAMSLKTGVIFEIVSLRGTPLPYPRERRRVLNALSHYVELSNSNPKGLPTYTARRQYETRLAELKRLWDTYFELQGTEFQERCHINAHYPAAFVR